MFSYLLSYLFLNHSSKVFRISSLFQMPKILVIIIHIILLLFHSILHVFNYFSVKYSFIFLYLSDIFSCATRTSACRKKLYFPCLFNIFVLLFDPFPFYFSYLCIVKLSLSYILFNAFLFFLFEKQITSRRPLLSYILFNK